MLKIDCKIENGIITYTVFGTIALNQINERARKDIEELGIMPRMWDFSQAQFEDIDYSKMFGFVNHIEADVKRREGVKVALVSDNDDNYPYIRMFESMISQVSVREIYRSFKDINQAREWLKLDGFRQED